MVDEDGRYHWFVVFRKGDAPYPYKFRNLDYMTAVFQKSYDRTGSYPFRVWVIIDDEIQKVTVSK